VAIVSPNGVIITISLLVALTFYLAAAALGVRWVAWVAIPVASALMVAGGLVDIKPWVVLGTAAVVLVVFGLLRHASRTALAAQSWQWWCTGGSPWSG